jgi:hypothetical protein
MMFLNFAYNANMISLVLPVSALFYALLENPKQVLVLRDTLLGVHYRAQVLLLASSHLLVTRVCRLELQRSRDSTRSPRPQD